ENNRIHVQAMEEAYCGIAAIMEQVTELNLGIRPDHLLCNTDVVYHNSDRNNSLAFLLFRNGFRRISFLQGISKKELQQLIQLLNESEQEPEYRGEDLVSRLWRLQLPHLVYVAIDTLASCPEATIAEPYPVEEIDVIQNDLQELVSQLYASIGEVKELTHSISLGVQDVETAPNLSENTRTLDEPEGLNESTARVLIDIPEEQLAEARSHIESEYRVDLIKRGIFTVVDSLTSSDSPALRSSAIEIVQELYDILIFGREYTIAREVIENLQHRSEFAEDIRQANLLKNILRLFVSESRICSMLEVFHESYRSTPTVELMALLRAHGSEVSPVLLCALERLESSPNRKLVRDLIVELGVPEVVHLEQSISGARWFVVRDILELARQYPRNKINHLVIYGLNHEHPRVREQAVSMLRESEESCAEIYLAERLNDEDAEVRMVAARVAGLRRSQDVLPTMQNIIHEDLTRRNLKELRVLLGAYALIVGEASVPVLVELLFPRMFGKNRRIDIAVAAASALGLVGNAQSLAYLTKGLRSFHGRVRDACRVALPRLEYQQLITNQEVSGDGYRSFNTTAQGQTRNTRIYSDVDWAVYPNANTDYEKKEKW
ncbi:MAG: HEAT repeat domain-containing protein, partial [Myxococcales bacterium]|nr:HEAT repeat domain-containing protein [Myxococcales bacterium]